MYRREMEKAESDARRNTSIIADYKQICSQLSERLEKQQTGARQEMDRLRVSGGGGDWEGRKGRRGDGYM